MPKKPKLNYESRVALAKEKIKEKPQRALQEIGKFLVKEIRKSTPKFSETRRYKNKSGKLITVKPGGLRRSIGYWYRKKEGDLQIGSKAFYAWLVEYGDHNRSKNPFLMPSVMKNVSVIQDMIKEALKELNKE
jgi:hypothetical protein